ESLNRIGKTLDEVGDGGWQEGIGYLNYMIDSSLEFADVLNRVTDGKCNLYKHPRFDDAVRTFIFCQIPPDKSVHFGDSGGGTFGSYSLFNDLAAETGNPCAAWLRKNLTDDHPASLMDCIRPKSTITPALPNEVSVRFPAVEWVIMRSDFTDPEKVVIAAKSGLHNDPHHGHLDSGHFSLYWRGQEFICDHGSAGYDKAYFDEERWNYPLASSIGHNTVIVNGEKQIPGKLKNKPWDMAVGGKIVEFRPGKNRDYTIMDQTKAYPGVELKGWSRHIILEKPLITVVLDEVTCSKGAEIEVRYHSSAEYSIMDNYVFLKGDKGNMAVIPAIDCPYTIRPGKHAVMMAQRNATFRWVPYFGTVVNAPGERTVIATVILPAEHDREAANIASTMRYNKGGDGSLVLSFSKGGKTYSYRFRRGADGLVLE
ncbi:heparinase II/III family protein, partial [bacterium]|nr:heparinase II/III family protein [bacterium]